MAEHPVDVVTDDIIAWVYSDTRVDLMPLRWKLRRAVADDMAENEHRMTHGPDLDSDVYVFVCSDLDDERRKQLVALYPRTDAFLNGELG